MKVHRANIKIKGAVGETFAVDRACAQIEGIKSRLSDTCELIVVSNLQRELILGIDAIKKFGLTLDITNDVIHSNGMSTNYRKFPEYGVEIF